MMNHVKAKVLGAGLLLIASLAAADDCSQSEQFYQLANKAGGEKDFETAAEWLNKSVDLCAGYRNWHLLGRAEQKLGHLDKSLNAYEQAVHFAANDNEKANAIGRYGQVLALNGQRQEAANMLHAARQLHSQPAPEWMTSQAKELDLSLAENPVSAEQIKRGLASRHYGLLSVPTKSDTRISSVPIPSVNIRINFIYNSSQVDDFSKQNVSALASALSDDAYNDRQFLLIGHSDARGKSEYNRDLSLDRAEAIRDMLVAIEPGLEGRLDTTGYGESKPLYYGNTDEDYRLNRRLEVVVE